MRKTTLRLLLEFVAITAPLTWLWMELLRPVYLKGLVLVATPLFQLLGVTGFPPGPIQAHFINYVPFLGLMLVTPGLRWRKRVTGCLIGFAVIFAMHVAVAWMAYIVFVRDGAGPDSMQRMMPILLFSDSLPFVLWAVAAREFVRDLLQRTIPARPPAGTDPGD